MFPMKENYNLQYPKNTKNFSEKKIKFLPKKYDSQTLHIGFHTPNKIQTT